MKKPRILLVDAADNAARYRDSLTALGPLELACERPSAAADRLAAESFDLAVIALPDDMQQGLDLVAAARAADPLLPVIVLAARPSVESATASLRLGAGDYLAGSLEPAALAASAARLLGQRRQGAEYELLRRQVERPYRFDDMIGGCPAMQKVFATIEQVAAADVDVLVQGETGTGKELVARSIHRRSRRASGPFVPVDCGAIPENLLESEFFGHEKGAFTGADARRIGLVEFAEGGTFFLDELGELPPLLQAKLLRMLQERRVRRVGGREEIDVDVRIVAATARRLEDEIAQGRFRQDLFYRINVVRIELPPLRERGDDIGLLAEHLVVRHSRELGKSVRGLAPEAYQVLASYHWPGNVRELQNVIRRALALSSGTLITLEQLPDELVASAGRDAAAPQGYFQLRDQHVARFEQQYLAELLSRHKGDVRAAAREAQLPRGTLYRLLKNHGLDSSRFRG